MSRRKRWLTLSALAAALVMVLGLSLSSIALAQEARWEALNSQAFVLYKQGKYRGAIPLAKESLKVAEQTFGPDHHYVATSLNILAVFYEAQGKHAEAEPPQTGQFWGRIAVFA